MIISPCAMLMTPMTPKVIARPIAASSRMLPRLMPSEQVRGDADQLQPPVDRFDCSVGGLLQLGIECRRRRATGRAGCGSAGSVLAPSARDRGELLLLAAGEQLRRPARPAASPRGFRDPVRRRCAFSSRGAVSAEGCRSASARRARPARRGSGLNSVSWPSAASMSPRSRLLTRIASRPLGVQIGDDLAASPRR